MVVEPGGVPDFVDVFGVDRGASAECGRILAVSLEMSIKHFVYFG